MSLQYNVQINDRCHMLVQISHRIENKQQGENGKWKKMTPKIQEMLWNNENKTVQFFIVDFKINKNYQQENAKINLEFSQ